MDSLPFPNLSAPSLRGISFTTPNRGESRLEAHPSLPHPRLSLIFPRSSSTNPRASQPCMVFGNATFKCKSSNFTLKKILERNEMMILILMHLFHISQFACQVTRHTVPSFLFLRELPPEAMLVNRTDAFKHALTHPLTDSVSRSSAASLSLSMPTASKKID